MADGIPLLRARSRTRSRSSTVSRTDNRPLAGTRSNGGKVAMRSSLPPMPHDSAVANCIGETLVLAGSLVLMHRRGLGAQTRLTIICLGFTIVCVFAQHLPWPFPAIPPIVYAIAFGWKCLQDLRWSVGALSQGRSMTANLGE